VHREKIEPRVLRTSCWCEQVLQSPAPARGRGDALDGALGGSAIDQA
jgi:hypothetical protein